MIKWLIIIVSSLFQITLFAQQKTPVIDVTDLYQMHQDVGDNIDLINAYTLPGVDLKAVILDCSEGFRGVKGGLVGYSDPAGPRDAGFIPVLQLNYIFDRNVPFGVGPFIQMRTPGDKMTDVPEFQQSGINLILKVLSESKDKVDIVSFGSARSIAVAYNRNPGLFMQKVSHIHLSAGGGYPDRQEWNVGLDPKAIICLLQSSLPVYLYPCASRGKGNTPKDYWVPSFTVDTFNTYWKLKNKSFIKEMTQPLKRYLAYALGKTSRNDFLRAMDTDDSTEIILQRFYGVEHHVWCSDGHGIDIGGFKPGDPSVGALSIHCYEGKPDDKFKDGLKLASELKLPFFIAEMGTFFMGEFEGEQMAMGGPRSEAPKSYEHQIINAEKILVGLNMGVDGFNRWSFVNRGDLDGQWQLIRTWNPNLWDFKKTVEPEPVPYYSFGIITRFAAKHSSVLESKSSTRNLVATTLRSPKGQVNVYLLNLSEKDTLVNVNFSTPAKPIEFKIYQITKESVSKPGFDLPVMGTVSINKNNSSMQVLIPGKSITTYTTYDLAPNSDGIISE